MTVPRGHLAPFRESARPWLVLARNAIPVAGVYALDWSAGLTVFWIWFDGVAALGAMIAFMMHAFALKDPDLFPIAEGGSVLLRYFSAAFIWSLMLMLLGIPYWFGGVLLALRTGDAAFWHSLANSTELLIILIYVCASNIAEEWKRGFARMSDVQIRDEFHWEFSVHLARIVAMMLVALFLPLGAIAGLALALSYVEIYPVRALRILGGDSGAGENNERRGPD